MLANDPYVPVTVTLKGGRTESGKMRRSEFEQLERAARAGEKRFFTLREVASSTQVCASQVAALKRMKR